MRLFGTIAATVLSGTHIAGVMLAQGYGDYYGLRRAPRFSPPYEYSRPYDSSRGDRDVYHPAERDWNRAMRRFEYERQFRERTYPGRPY